jgi:uncharacterized membrane protein
VSTQPNLFDDANRGSARRADPETAKAAAKSIDATDLEQTVLNALRIIGARGATTEELASDLNLPLVTISPRLAPLVRKNLVKDSGRRGTNASGRKAILWVIA